MRKSKNVILTDSGVDKTERLSTQKYPKNNNFYDPENLDLVHHTMLLKPISFLEKIRLYC